jgi:hypothetical protein
MVSGNAMKLLSGEYILLSKSQRGFFAKAMGNLVVQNGFVVLRDRQGVPDDRIAKGVPTVTRWMEWRFAEETGEEASQREASKCRGKGPKYPRGLWGPDKN